MLRCAELMPCSVVTSLWLSSSDFRILPLSPLWRQVPWEMGNLWLDLSKEGIKQTPCQPLGHMERIGCVTKEVAEELGPQD